MFDNIELFTKRNNIAVPPDRDLTTKSVIHCTCELSTGFGSKNIKWTYGNSIKLTKMIEFYNKLYFFETHSSVEEFEYQFAHNDFFYIFSCYRRDRDLLYALKMRYYDRERVLLEKKNVYWRNEFYIHIMKKLTSCTNNDVSTKIGELFFKIRNDYPHDYEYKIGQKVKTLLSENIKTKRTGYVINRFYHDKRKTRLYQIMEDGTLLNTWYRPDELEKID
ncbi:MAG: hypothetical protein LBV71_20200 [Prevotella sp.]|jgi:hypothetical protein|nr:hypothetical protein [Prevotella sp.]